MKFDLAKFFFSPGKLNVVEPSTFNDPIALKTAWAPLKGGGTSFRTHMAVQTDASRIEFKRTLMCHLFPLFFIFLPIVILAGFFYSASQDAGFYLYDSDNAGLLLSTGFLLIAGLVLYYLLSKHIIFDRGIGMFIKGKLPDPGQPPMAPGKNNCQLSEIHALQIISEWVSGNKSSYTSYELNIVKKDGERLNVVDHGNWKKLSEDAHLLGQFLGVPVWDKTGRSLIAK